MTAVVEADSVGRVFIGFWAAGVADGTGEFVMLTSCCISSAGAGAVILPIS